VPVAEGDERHAVPPWRRCLRHRPLYVALVAEVRPPEGGGERQREQGDENEINVELQAGRPDPDHDDRLAERDDDDQSVALDEVRGRDQEAIYASSRIARMSVSDVPRTNIPECRSTTAR
jgi:hypothetical protein